MSSDPIANEILELLEQSSEYASYLGELGVETVAPINRQSLIERQPDSATTARPRFSSEPSAPAPSHLPPPTPAMPRRAVESDLSAPSAPLFGDLSAPAALDKSSETLEEIWQDIGDCTRCGLCEARTQVVNTHGNHKARLMFVGEAPGADEDAQGKPFVGRAGQLLTKIIEAIGLKREDVLIGNVNRCRPPGNRQPTLEEAAICRPFLFREIAAVQPEVIVVMGNTALRNLLETREGITRVRGKFQDFRGIKVMPTFHPAYLLRDPSKKRETWEDLKKVRDYLDNSAARPSHS
ncbi:MAG: uracil-DNA glycosylase family protein [Acidobacteriota bacterium]